MFDVKVAPRDLGPVGCGHPVYAGQKYFLIGRSRSRYCARCGLQQAGKILCREYKNLSARLQRSDRLRRRRS
jgi:hypothetical protein